VYIGLDSAGKQGRSGGVARRRRCGSGKWYSLSWTDSQYDYSAHGPAPTRSYHSRYQVCSQLICEFNPFTSVETTIIIITLP